MTVTRDLSDAEVVMTVRNYYRTNPHQGYCQFVVGPKVKKFRKQFLDKLKKPQ